MSFKKILFSRDFAKKTLLDIHDCDEPVTRGISEEGPP